MKIPKLLQAVLVILGVYMAFKIIFGGTVLGVVPIPSILDHPVPVSLLKMYMFFVIVGVLLVFTSTEEGTKELVAPIRAMMEDPSKKNMRNVIFIILPLLCGVIVYQYTKPSFDAPLELRSIHPAPPSTIKAFSKRYDLDALENPYRKLEKDDPDRFKELVREGGDLYAMNCQYCHGDKLDGKGPYAQGLDPLPTNFQDVGTIAQLQESYLFWRISTGGPGLPKEASPWKSAMPAWKDFLSEDETWKVILFLYDYTGQSPRSWSESH